MNFMITFFMWLFGWTAVETPAPLPALTPTAQENTITTEGFEPERARQGQNQTVTIIIYDDTHFRVK